jgi:hypothetical protein
MRYALAVTLLVACEIAGAGQFKLVGRFDNVSSADRGEHCQGYSLSLWESDGRMLGLLDHHSGPCGDPPCAVIQSAKFDRKTGRLTFWSTISSERLQVVGAIRSNDVVGRLNRKPLGLARQPLTPGAFEPDQSLAAWCSFWESVPRCTGVKDVCETLR